MMQMGMVIELQRCKPACMVQTGMVQKIMVTDLQRCKHDAKGQKQAWCGKSWSLSYSDASMMQASMVQKIMVIDLQRCKHDANEHGLQATAMQACCKLAWSPDADKDINTFKVRNTVAPLTLTPNPHRTCLPMLHAESFR
eukprot:1160878-Pelagomonas_calceolata.AAC.7